MSILVDETTRVLVQGITGREGSFHTRRMRDDGTNVVAGVTPGKGGRSLDSVPIFDDVAEAVEATGADASILFVPAAFAAGAMLDAAEAGIELIVCLTEGVPVHDMIEVRWYLDEHGTTLIGPNTPGVISPGKCRLGVMDGRIHRPGPVGILSRSGTLAYEVAHQLTALDLGQSTCVGIGGDPIIGAAFSDLLPAFEGDPETSVVVLIGEIGGPAEEEAAAVIADRIRKPVVAYVAGRSAPPGRRMGHAGALIDGESATAEAKIASLRDAGVLVVDSPATVGLAVADLLA